MTSILKTNVSCFFYLRIWKDNGTEQIGLKNPLLKYLKNFTSGHRSWSGSQWLCVTKLPRVKYHCYHCFGRCAVNSTIIIIIVIIIFTIEVCYHNDIRSHYNHGYNHDHPIHQRFVIIGITIPLSLLAYLVLSLSLALALACNGYHHFRVRELLSWLFLKHLCFVRQFHARVLFCMK